LRQLPHLSVGNQQSFATGVDSRCKELPSRSVGNTEDLVSARRHWSKSSEAG